MRVLRRYCLLCYRENYFLLPFSRIALNFIILHYSKWGLYETWGPSKYVIHISGTQFSWQWYTAWLTNIIVLVLGMSRFSRSNSSGEKWRNHSFYLSRQQMWPKWKTGSIAVSRTKSSGKLESSICRNVSENKGKCW